jgi:hypothetical protein
MNSRFCVAIVLKATLTKAKQHWTNSNCYSPLTLWPQHVFLQMSPQSLPQTAGHCACLCGLMSSVPSSQTFEYSGGKIPAHSSERKIFQYWSDVKEFLKPLTRTSSIPPEPCPIPFSS